jgi:hypothetical protein
MVVLGHDLAQSGPQTPHEAEQADSSAFYRFLPFSRVYGSEARPPSQTGGRNSHILVVAATDVMLCGCVDWRCRLYWRLPPLDWRVVPQLRHQPHPRQRLHVPTATSTAATTLDRTPLSRAPAQSMGTGS